MDLNAVKMEALQKQCDKLQMQIDAMCKLYGVQLEYKPDCYEAQTIPKEEEEGEGY